MGRARSSPPGCGAIVARHSIEEQSFAVAWPADCCRWDGASCVLAVAVESRDERQDYWCVGVVGGDPASIGRPGRTDETAGWARSDCCSFAAFGRCQPESAAVNDCDPGAVGRPGRIRAGCELSPATGGHVQDADAWLWIVVFQRVDEGDLLAVGRPGPRLAVVDDRHRIVELGRHVERFHVGSIRVDDPELVARVVYDAFRVVEQLFLERDPATVRRPRRLLCMCVAPLTMCGLVRSAFTTHTDVVLSLAIRVNATRFPSGDHRGSTSEPRASVVIRRAPVPSAAAVNSEYRNGLTDSAMPE